MYKLAVLGEEDSVLGFSALGLDTFPVDNSEGALRTFRKITKERDIYAIIYVTETFYPALSDEIEKLKTCPTPAVILIPGRGGSKGYGTSVMESAIERAVGSVIK